MAPVVRACQEQQVPFFLIHTGQHYSYVMDKIFLEELGLPPVQYHLEVGSGSHAQQTARILCGIERILFTERPDIILIQGDTNTVLAGALASSKSPTRIGHVEAGLRSYDRSMPEEVNRVLADHVSDYLFAPTNIAKQNLLHEGIEEEKIFVTGNTIVDSVLLNRELATKKSRALSELNLKPKNYFLLTAHRTENVDYKQRMQGLLEAMRRICESYKMPLVWPIHPRTKKNLEIFGLNAFAQTIPMLRIIEPLGFWDFLTLLSDAHLVLTDSGGIQEETCILQVPCVTLRQNTERPETLSVRSNMLAGTDPDRIVRATDEMLNRPKNWVHPFGDGTAGRQIVEIVKGFSYPIQKVEGQHVEMNSIKV